MAPRKWTKPRSLKATKAEFLERPHTKPPLPIKSAQKASLGRCVISADDSPSTSKTNAPP